MGYVIVDPVSGQPISASLFGLAVKDAINDLDSRAAALENSIRRYAQRTSDIGSITGTTLVEVMSVDLPRAGTYTFDVFALMNISGAVGRPGFALGGTATATSWRWASGTVHYNNATGSQGFNASGTSYPGSTSPSPLTNSDFTTTGGFSHCTIRGTVNVSAAGTLTFRFAVSSGAATLTIRQGTIATVDLTT